MWAEVVNLLGDPDQLRAMAAEWVGMADTDQDAQRARVADLNQQVADREKAMTETLTETLTTYARLNVPASTIEEVVTTLTGELEQLKEMRDEAQRWMDETQAAEQRANDLAASADLARTRLADMTPEEQGEILALLDVRVTVTGPMPDRKTNKGCTLTKWFADSGRLVPPPLTNEVWALVEPVVKAWEPPNHRLIDGGGGRRHLVQGAHPVRVVRRRGLGRCPLEDRAHSVQPLASHHVTPSLSVEQAAQPAFQRTSNSPKEPDSSSCLSASIPSSRAAS